MRAPLGAIRVTLYVPTLSEVGNPGSALAGREILNCRVSPTSHELSRGGGSTDQEIAAVPFGILVPQLLSVRSRNTSVFAMGVISMEPVLVAHITKFVPCVFTVADAIWTLVCTWSPKARCKLAVTWESVRVFEVTENTTSPAPVMAPIINMLVTIILSMFRRDPWTAYEHGSFQPITLGCKQISREVVSC